VKLYFFESDGRVKILNKAWLSFLFNAEIVPLGEDVELPLLPLYIVSGDRNLEPEYRSIEFDYFRKLSEAGHNFGLIHIMDEYYNHILSAYEIRGCQVVFREYVRPKGGRVEFLTSCFRSFSLRHPHFKDSLFVPPIVALKQLKYRFTYGYQFLERQYLPTLPNKTIRPIPLGYTDVIAEFAGLDTPAIDKRKFVWSFCGDIFKADRQKMIASLSSIEPHYSYTYQGFMGANSLSGRDYWEVLSNSIYSPCPIGNYNIDTYRLFESLEAGAIPIVIQNHAGQPYEYYRDLLGDHPIPTVRQWRQAKDFIRRTSTSEIILLSQRIAKWYDVYKREVRTSIKDILTSIASQS